MLAVTGSCEYSAAPSSRPAAGANNVGNNMANAANLLNNIEQRMSNASAEDIAKLTQQVQNDPAIKSLIARGVIKYSDLLNADGSINGPRMKQISEALAKRRRGRGGARLIRIEV
eukprot:COSAG02_NODE_4005_length_5922_cov_40.612227_6_plen_115_part_00